MDYCSILAFGEISFMGISHNQVLHVLKEAALTLFEELVGKIFSRSVLCLAATLRSAR